MAAHITTGKPIGQLLKRDIPTQLREMQDLFMALIDELQTVMYSLDAGNVIEASSVKAQNIDTKTAQIIDAQIKNITASKLTAGIIDTEDITIQGEDGRFRITGNRLLYVDDNNEVRLEIGKDDNHTFGFMLADANGVPKLVQTSTGDAVFSGRIIGGSIESNTTIDVGTDASIGGRLNMNTLSASGGIYFYYFSTPIARITVSPESEEMYIVADGGVRINANLLLNGLPVATQYYVDAAIKDAIQKHIDEYH